MTIVWTGASTITGLAADTMPTNVPTNTAFIETDTQKQFLFNGTTWDLLSGKLEISTSNGTFVLANNTTEQDVTEITNNLDRVGIVYDVSLLTQNTTIRVKEKADGTNYEIVSEVVFPTDFDSGAENIEIELNGKNRDQKVTFQSGTAEGATRDIPFARVNELRTV